MIRGARMSRSTRRGLVLAGLLAAVSLWLASGDHEDAAEPIEGLDTRLDYALEDFEMRGFDEKGALAIRLWAPRLTNEAATRIGRVQQPRVEVLHEGRLWNIMAETATISDDQGQVFLGGDVRLERAGAPDLGPLEVDSRDVTLVVDERIARSASDVRMEDPAGELRARGFRIDMRTDEFQLHHDVQGVYVLP